MPLGTRPRAIIRAVWYVYPIWKKVSFTLIARKHLEYLRQMMKIDEIDEHTFPFMDVVSRPLVLIQPYFYPMEAYSRPLSHRIPKLTGLIGIDVADSDRISEFAVELANKATAMIVPSRFARKAYIMSGVKAHVHVLPHGVDLEFINSPKRERPFPETLYDLKRSRRLKVLLAFIIHSGYRKGYDILMQIYKRLRKERRDVILVIKDMYGVRLVEDDREKRLFDGWLRGQQHIDLFDNADLFLLTSRGGGFELPGLEALARGVPTIAAKGGSWDDYMPPWGQVPSKRSGPVFQGNSIHVGNGVEMIINKAVDKALEILDNLDEYKAKAHEYAQTRIKREFTWPRVALELKRIIDSYR